MKHAKRIGLVAFLGLVVVVAGASMFLKDSQQKEAQVVAQAAVEPSPLHQVIESDVVMGDPNAPVTIIEYSSMSCPHCAHFHAESFPELKTKYIDTGKAKFVNRHFPLNEPALKAGMVTLCVPKEKFYPFLTVFFETQDKWAFDDQYLENLRKIAMIGGMSSDSFDACMANIDMEKQLLESRQKAQDELKLQSTPSFFVNGVRFEGGSHLKEMMDAIEAALK